MNGIKRSLPLVQAEGSATGKQQIDVSKRINHREEFELAYLRWRYFLRAENPDVSLIEKYRKAAYKAANESYRENQNIYKASGMEPEDVRNIALVHLVSYLGIFSLQHNKTPKTKFIASFQELAGREPTDAETAREDLTNMLCFIAQRMNDLIRICKQKNRSITGELSATALFRLVGKETECSDLKLYFSPNAFGYKKVGPAEYREVKKALNKAIPYGRFELDGKVYRFVREILGPVWLSDHEGADDLNIFNPQDNTMTQEYSESLRIRYAKERILDRYKKTSKRGKKRILNKVIKMLSSRKGFEKEVQLAKELLAGLE